MTVRILHFIDTLGAGGTERQLVYLLENLDRVRYSSTVVTTYDHFRHYEPTLQALDVPLFSLHHGNLTPSQRARALQRYVRLMWSLKPDLVHSWLHYPNLIAQTTKLLCPRHKLIASVRTELSARAARLEEILLPFSDFRIVNYQHREPLTNPITNQHTATIPNGVDLHHYQNCAPSNSHLQFNLLMPARIDPRKDHNTLIQAIAQLPATTKSTLRTTLIGEITCYATQAKLEQSIKNLKLEDIIRQLPPTTNIQPHYANASVVILPSQSEGTPNVILEAFATGRPVIASTAANHANLITEGVNGWLFPTGNSHALANVLQRVMNTPPAIRQQMGMHARREAEKYPISRMVDAYSTIYELLVADE